MYHLIYSVNTCMHVRELLRYLHCLSSLATLLIMSEVSSISQNNVIWETNSCSSGMGAFLYRASSTRELERSTPYVSRRTPKQFVLNPAACVTLWWSRALLSVTNKITKTWAVITFVVTEATGMLSIDCAKICVHRFSMTRWYVLSFIVYSSSPGRTYFNISYNPEFVRKGPFVAPSHSLGVRADYCKRWQQDVATDLPNWLGKACQSRLN